MEIILAQFKSQSGPHGGHTHKFIVEVDEIHKQPLLDLASRCTAGTELLMMVFETKNDRDEMKDFAVETPQEMKKRLNRRMHAMINNIAKEKKKEVKEIKKYLKEYLIRKKYIRESTAELELEGFASAIYYLQHEFKD